MNDKSITIHLPDELYERMQETAQASDRSLETLLIESLDVLFGQPTATWELERLLADLTTYSDAELWAVVYRRLRWSQSLRLRELNAKSKQGTLTETEQAELDSLIDLVDRLMLLRSEALLLLKARGKDIDSYLKLGA